MGGYLRELQRGTGRALKQIFKAGGVKYRYNLITDLTDPKNNQNSLDIFMQPTPRTRIRVLFGARVEMQLSAAGQLAPEALPVYIVSRESLKVSGTFHNPTDLDSFQELDAAGNLIADVFFVEQIVAIGGLAAGFLLTVTSQFRDHARG